jgi:hypothetical protein
VDSTNREIQAYCQISAKKQGQRTRTERENMSFIPLPDPDPEILKRRVQIARDLAKLAPDAVFIEDEEGRQA